MSASRALIINIATQFILTVGSYMHVYSYYVSGMHALIKMFVCILLHKLASGTAAVL